MIKDGDAGEFNEQVRNLARHCLQNILLELEERVAETEALRICSEDWPGYRV